MTTKPCPKASCRWLPNSDPDRPDGSVTVDEQGYVAFDLYRAPGIGIADMAEIVDFRIAAIAGSISYHVRFCNGGELNYAFNRKGELLDLWGRHVSFTASPEGGFLFRALGEP